MDNNLALLNTPVQNTINVIAAVQSTIDAINLSNSTLASQNSALTSQNASLQTQINTLDAQIAAAGSVVVFPALETTTWLLAPGASANTGSTGSLATATQAQPSSSSAWFNIAPLGAYADAYWYKTLGANPSKTNYTYQLSFMFNTAADAAASQCVELDIQQCIGGVVYNTGWQFDFAENTIRTWNRYAKERGLPNPWVSTGLLCPRWVAGQWMHIFVENHRDASNVYSDAITINGVRTPINLSFPAPSLGLSDMLNCAVQLDSNSTATAYKLYVDNIIFTAS